MGDVNSKTRLQQLEDEDDEDDEDVRVKKLRLARIRNGEDVGADSDKLRSGRVRTPHHPMNTASS